LSKHLCGCLITGIHKICSRIKITKVRRYKRIHPKLSIRVITKLPNSEQSYKGKVEYWPLTFKDDFAWHSKHYMEVGSTDHSPIFSSDHQWVNWQI
jgi:hypothetical protein